MRGSPPTRARLRPILGWNTGLILADLGSKALAIRIAGSADRGLLTPRVNRELALGVASADSHPIVLFLLAAIALAVFTHATRLYRRGQLSAFGLSSLTAGALANALDRVFTGGVHDWLRTGSIVLNLADVFIVIGLLWYVRASWRASDQ